MSGGPLRAAVSGAGGNRLFLVVPEPITAELWRAATGNLRNVEMARLSEIDRIGDAQVSLAPRGAAVRGWSDGNLLAQDRYAS